MNETSRQGGTASGTARNIRFYGFQGEQGLSERIRALGGEWDAEKFVLVGLSGAGAFGLLMGLFGSRLWRVLTWAALPLLLLAGLERWRPSRGLIKSLGLRSRKEILEEKYALKALRGDFLRVDAEWGESEGETISRSADQALDAVKA